MALPIPDQETLARAARAVFGEDVGEAYLSEEGSYWYFEPRSADDPMALALSVLHERFGEGWVARHPDLAGKVRVLRSLPVEQALASIRDEILGED